MRATLWIVLLALAGPAGRPARAAPAGPGAVATEEPELAAQRRRSRPPPAIEHTRVRKQIWNHPVPLFLTVREDLRPMAVQLFYRARGETEYQSLLFAPWPTGGWYAEIPCSTAQPTRWEYYIVVWGAGNEELATEASARRPHRVDMEERVDRPPLRPDGTWVESCNPDGSTPVRLPDCPPGMVCDGRECRACTVSEECAPGEECLAGCCQVLQTPAAPVAEETHEPAGVFLRLGAGVGAGVIHGIINEWNWYEDPLRPGEFLPGPDAVVEQFDPGTQLVLAGAVVRLELGWFPIPELSVSLLGRMSFPFGDEFPWQVQARGTWWFRLGDDHRLGAFVGAGAGRLAHRLRRVSFVQLNEFSGAMVCPPDTRARCQTFSPYWRSSGWGVAGAGVQYLYLFTHWFGLGGELALDAAFPDFSFNMDFAASAYFAF